MQGGGQDKQQVFQTSYAFAEASGGDSYHIVFRDEACSYFHMKSHL